MGSRACFKYSIDADFANPLVCEARGIIIDIKKEIVVCWPFNKFFNVQEQYAADIDWNSAKVLEKIDGSLIKLYYYDGNWVFATSSTCDAKDAPIKNYRDLTYKDIILQADNYRKIPFDNLNKRYTYLFELVSPMTQVVIKYNVASLYYLATKKTATGEEVEYDLKDFKKPKTFPIKTVSECLTVAEELNKNSDANVTDEGFVVVDKNHNRIKIKSPIYVGLHHMAVDKSFTGKSMARLFTQNTDFNKLAKEFPDNAHIIKYYDWQFEEIKHKIKEIIEYTKALYEEYDHDRKAVASIIKKSPYAWAGFMALDTQKDTAKIISTLNASKLGKLIKEYSA